MHRIAVAALLLVPFVGSALAQDAPADWAELHKGFRAAFRPLPLPSPGDLERSVVPSLPAGIVIDSVPFDALVAKLTEPFEPMLRMREEVMKGLAALPESRTGKLVKDGLKVLAREEKDLEARCAKMEAAYAAAYNKGYMESSEADKEVRKLAAVVLPFYGGLAKRSLAVRELMVAVLAAMREGEARDWLAGSAMTDSEEELRATAAQALSRVGGGAAREALEKAAAKDAAPGVRLAALNGLMSWPLAEVKGAVIEALSDDVWEVRALAVSICREGKLVSAAEALIRAMAKEEGRLRKDMDDALADLVGVRYYGDAKLWEKWWEGKREEVEAKAKEMEASGAWNKPLGPVKPFPAAEGKATAEEEKAATVSFYGISTFSKKIVYIIDISKSMEGEAGGELPQTTGQGSTPYDKPAARTKIGIAKWQLHRAVHSLPKDAVFNIIVYSESFKVWQEAMTPASPRGKAMAHEFIDGLVPNGTTNIYDSLSKAFALAEGDPRTRKKGLAADTFFLLSDGNPNRGLVTDPAKILETVGGRNGSVGVVIHAVGIGEAAGSPFMKSLAEQNGGRYTEFR